MVQRVKEIPAKPVDMNSTPETHMVRGITNSCKCPLTLHSLLRCVMYMHKSTHIHTYAINQNVKKLKPAI